MAALGYGRPSPVDHDQLCLSVSVVEHTTEMGFHLWTCIHVLSQYAKSQFF